MKSAAAFQASLSSWHWSETQLSHPLVKKGPGKENCDLKSFIFGTSRVVCGKVFKQAWEDLASFLLGLCKEKEKVMKELWGIKLFHGFDNYFSECVVCRAR